MISMRPFLFGILVSLLFACGCSAGRDIPVTPDKSLDDLSFIPTIDPADTIGHEIVEFGTIQFDLENLTATIIPDRLAMHEKFSCFSWRITGFNWNPPVVNVGIEITNNCGFSVYDFRLIIYTDNLGHELINEDDWTPLFDRAGGSFINPFKAYAKGGNREFAAGAKHTETLQIKFPDRKLVMVGYAMEASRPSDCNEPYSIVKLGQQGNQVGINVYDWQNDVNKVVMIAPNITGEPFTNLTYQTGNTWSVVLQNNMGVAEGDYEVLFYATSTNSGTLPLYDYLSVTISACSLIVSEIDGPDNLNENTEASYSVTASGDTGITYQWTVEPADKGSFNPPNTASTIFTAGDVTVNTWVTLRVTVDSTNCDPIARTKNVLINYVPTQPGEWPVTWGGTDSDQAYDIVIDPNDNIFVAGRYKGTNVDFDPGDGEDLHTSSGGYDAFLSMFNFEGEFQWCQTWGGTAEETVNSMYVDNMGNIYLVGYKNNRDFYLSRFKQAASYSMEMWTWDKWTSILTSGNALGVYSDNTGMYLTGRFNDGNLDFDPGSGQDKHPTTGADDIFVIKLDPNGNYLWGRNYGSNQNDVGRDVVVDNSYNVYVIGTYNESTSILDDNTTFCLLEYNSVGDLINEPVPIFGGDAYIRIPMDMEIVDGIHIYYSGYFNGTTDFSPGPDNLNGYANGGFDCFLAKIELDGDGVWVKSWGAGGEDEANHIAVNSNFISVSGYFSLSVDLNPGSSTDYHTSKGNNDVFISKFDHDGNYVFGYSCGGTALDRGFGTGMTSSNYTFGCGYFNNTIDFGNDVTKPSNGGDDVFVLKLDQSGNLVP